jgi:hypothetical protein
MTDPAERPRYRFGPLDRRGLIAGWRSGQIASVGAGLLLAVFALHSRPSAASVVVALVAVVGSIALATWPIAGQTGEQWLPIVARWASGGRRRWVSGDPTRGHHLEVHLVDAAPKTSVRSRPTSRPARPFAGLDIVAVEDLLFETGDRSASRALRHLGVVHDRFADTYTAVLSVRGHSFALLGDRDKERRIASWSSALASMARDRTGVRRIQWLASTIPDDGTDVLEDAQRRAVAGQAHAASESYDDLLRTIGSGATRHQVLVALQVGGSRRARGAAACGRLLREVDALARQLGEADIVVEQALGAPELAASINANFQRRRGPDRSSGASFPWPLAVEPEWARVRLDGGWHATYWIAEWPRVDVGPDFLGPLLLGSVRRTTSVVMEPIAPGRAVRQVETARTAHLADAELRRRGGFLTTARRAREADTVVQRESELAEGHASFRFSGYVTVSAEDAEELETACQATEEAAGQAHLVVRRLYGDQLNAVTLTLPLCRGLA